MLTAVFFLTAVAVVLALGALLHRSETPMWHFWLSASIIFLSVALVLGVGGMPVK